MNNLKFNDFFKLKTKNNTFTVHIFYNLLNHPTFQLSKRKIMFCWSISIIIVYDSIHDFFIIGGTDIPHFERALSETSRVSSSQVSETLWVLMHPRCRKHQGWVHPKCRSTVGVDASAVSETSRVSAPAVSETHHRCWCFRSAISNACALGESMWMIGGKQLFWYKYLHG